MIFRTMLMLSVVLLLGACTRPDDGADSRVDVSNREAITAGPLTDAQVDETLISGSPLPGSQEDLVVNIGDRVFFGYDRYDLSSEARSLLEMQAQWLSQHSHLTVTIEGHADERGTREYNLALGERRANSVRSYLLALGVPASRISVISYGKERPSVLGSDPSAWAQNRRGVTVVD